MRGKLLKKNRGQLNFFDWRVKLKRKITKKNKIKE